MNVRHIVSFGEVELRFSFGIFKKFNAWKTGICNRCKNGLYVLFLDYDRVPLEWILEELLYLQKKHSIGDIHVFKTSKGFHVVNTEQRSFEDTLSIMRQTTSDKHFINVPLMTGKKAWTLRISHKNGKPKTKYVGTLKGKNKLIQSTPHNSLLKGLYDIPLKKAREDGEQNFYKAKYPITE